MFDINCFWNRNEKYYLQSNWRGKIDLDGGTLFTQFIHFIDLLYFFFGDLKSVYANRRNFSHSMIEFEDSGIVSFEMKNGAIGTMNYTTCALQKNMENSITIIAENGTLKIGGKNINSLEYGLTKDKQILNLKKTNNVSCQSLMPKVFRNVVDTLNSRDNIAVSECEGLKVVKIIEAIYESMKFDKKIFLN